MKTIIINKKETDYQINELGEIYSNKTNKILTGTIYNTGYRMVRLSTAEGKKGYAVHRLVAEAFIPNPNNLPVVNHKDGNKLNNAVENLEWVNQSQNRLHAIVNDISKRATGKRKIISLDELKKQGEEWKQYKDTNYLVSKHGHVYNKKTNILLKDTPNQSGYIRYTLRINNKNYTKQAHILVIETWTDLNLENKVVNHKDGNKENNYLDNLEVIDKRDNALHACYQLKKLVKPVIQIKEDGSQVEYPSIIEASRQMHVSDGAIRYALKNNSKSCNSYWKYK